MLGRPSLRTVLTEWVVYPLVVANLYLKQLISWISGTRRTGSR